MEPLQKIVRDEMLSAFARLLLFAADELEPLHEASLDGDLETVYAALARIETVARVWRRNRAAQRN